LSKLAGTKKFPEIVPVLILNGQKEMLYRILQTTSVDLRRLKASQLQIEDSLDAMLVNGDAILG